MRRARSAHGLGGSSSALGPSLPHPPFTTTPLPPPTPCPVFFSYVGFDVIATSGEEAINPSTNIPASIIVSLLACAAAYVSVSGIVTAMVGTEALDTSAPLASAFASVGAGWARYLVSIGSVAGLTTSLMTCIFPMPRIIYAICQDGLLPPWLGEVWPRYGTPVVATLICGGISAAMALIFDINSLADMSSIGTLMAYTLVAASVLVLRYKDGEETEDAAFALTEGSSSSSSGSSSSLAAGEETTPLTATLLSDDSLCATALDGRGRWVWRGLRPYAAASAFLSAFTLACALASACSVAYLNTPALTPGAAAVLGSGGLLGVLGMAATAFMLSTTPSALPRGVDFATPWCPWLPLLAIATNVYLMASLNPLTWVRFGVWCAAGMAIYFGYGMRHSILETGGVAAQ